MNIPIYQKIEIAFWDMAIDFLTQSKSVRFVIREYIHLSQVKNFKAYLALLAAGGILGFLIGFALPHFLLSIR